MKRITPIKLFKITACCILGWICFIVCMETNNMALLAGVIPVIIMVVLAYMLFDKLNKIIKLLQEIVDKDNESK